MTDWIWRDGKYALRQIARAPGFAAIAIVSLALGIGANAAIFSLVDQVLLRGLPVRAPEQIAALHFDGHHNGSSTSDNSEAVWPYPEFLEFQKAKPAPVEGFAARAGFAVSLGVAGAETSRVGAETVSGNFFRLLGVDAAAGRLLAPEDDAAGAPPAVVLDYFYWTGHLGGKREIVGQTVRVNGHPMTVVGVAARGFSSIIEGQVPSLYVPISRKREITPAWDGRDDIEMAWLTVFARLKPGYSAAQAQASLETVYRGVIEIEIAHRKRITARERARLAKDHLTLNPIPKGVSQLRTQWRTPLLVLMTMVGLVLLIACANVAGLLTARAAARRREIAVRQALGASRAVLVRQLVMESLALAVAGGLLGIAVSRWTLDALVRFLPSGDFAGVLSTGLDGRLLLFAFGISVATGLVFGVAPAMQATRVDVAPALKEQARGSSGSTAGFRQGLVVAQIAFSLMLLVGAGLFANSLKNLLRLDMGFRTENLMSFSVDPALNGYDAGRGLAFYRDLQSRLEALPGVTSVGATMMGPLANSGSSGNLTIEGRQTKEGDDPGASFDHVGPKYFATAGIPLLAGREVSERDTAGAGKVAVVNEAFAKKFLGGANPVGRHLGFGGGASVKLDVEIVGMVKSSKFGSVREQTDTPFVYTPYMQSQSLDRLAFYTRTQAEESAVGPRIRALVRSMDGNLPLFEMKTMQVRVAESIYTDRLIAVLSASFGFLATLLAAIGLYGVLAYTVARRTMEIGIRLALGASRGDVIGLVMREVGLLAGVGIAIGVVAAYGLGRFVESQLYGLKANDPATFAAAALGIAAVVMLAGLVPVRKATRIQPARALHFE